MRYLVVLTFVLTYASTQSHGGHNVVPKKGGFSHANNINNPVAPDTGRNWAHPVYNDDQEEPDKERPEEPVGCVDFFQAHTDSIVRTKDSLKAGAIFLSAPSPVSDIDECKGWCQCDSEDDQVKCDMVVFESNKKNCYLFHCVFDGENRCLFAHHQGYTSMLLNGKSFSKENMAASQAYDLQGLIDDEPTEVPDVTTKKAATTTAKTPTTDKTIDYSNPWYYYNAEDENKEDSDELEYPDFNNGDRDDGHYDYDRPGESSQETVMKSTESPPWKHHFNGKAESTSYEDGDEAESQTVPGEKAVEVTQRAAERTPGVEKSNPVTEKADSKNETTLEEQVIVEEVHTDSGRTMPETSAILPLAIGLAITLLLLLMVACRLRMVKRKLRYGRPLQNTQEADYLINGMYL